VRRERLVVSARNRIAPPGWNCAGSSTQTVVLILRTPNSRGGQWARRQVFRQAIYVLALDGLKIVYLHWTENFIERGLVKIDHS
jgi:hypothetical protein